MMSTHFDTTRQNANLQNKNRTETVYFTKEYKHVKPFSEDTEKI